MESLLVEQANLAEKGALSKCLEDVQRTIDILVKARVSVASSPEAISATLAKLQNPTKQSFDKINSSLKDIYAALGNYSKTLDRKFKGKQLPSASYDALSSQPMLINRAIGMHLLREGQFTVASAFMDEASNGGIALDLHSKTGESQIPLEQSPTTDSLGSKSLRKQFASMYYILDEMRSRRNLLPATAWARANSIALEARGSNLEFELGRLQFVWLFLKDGGKNEHVGLSQRQKSALAYARQEFGCFQGRYIREIQQLIGAMAFCPNLVQSPYRQIFHNDTAWDDLATSFTREFCSLLGLSADSPMYIATTAGAIALPTLQKLQVIMETKRTEWTTQNELPVEIPLPPAYRFHSIFVCPVSKEQTTDQNPPMMMPCGHVIAQDSLQRLSKVSKFKCPYCPGESQPKEAKKVFL